MLDKIIYLHSFTTGSFYTNHERHLHDLNMRCKAERRYLINGLPDLAKLGYSPSDIAAIKAGEEFNLIDETDKEVADYQFKQALIKHKGDKAAEVKERLKTLIANNFERNAQSKGKDHVRELRADVEGADDRIISTFDSFLTRTVGCEPDKVTTEIASLSVFYFEVFKDLLYYGFMWNGEKYVYYTSSAGMIRTKRGTFIKESTLKKIEPTMMCGLTVDKINAKGGNNVNKHLAYLALTNSATDRWEGFDIDKVIVVDDFERDVVGEVDFIDDNDFSISRKTMPVNIPNTDGVGMMLPCVSDKNFMIRLPWVKGLLGVFDFRSFVIEHGYSPIIKDIYGKEHDILVEDVQIILTKSQTKMWKYYSDWDEYKYCFKLYNCEACRCNIEEDYIKNSKINYQMLQDLFPTDEEIKKLTEKSRRKIENVSKNYKTIKEIMGLNRVDHSLGSFQQAVKLYKPLIRDVYTKDTLRDIKNSLLKKYRSGKIEISGKYTFILPDFYACCEYWFGHITDPKGLLDNGEVSCNLYSFADELDCLRAPHIYYEHGIRKNKVQDEKIKKWFTTNALYVSCNDLISKILMFDVDGDKSLVVADKLFIDIAKRSMEGHPPLYYEMHKALPGVITPETLYKGLTDAFTGGNIGIFANNASKIWNSEVFVSGSKEERERASSYVAIITALENYNIDYAKTLYKPELPKDLNNNIAEFTKHKLPAFFEFAKDKGNEQIDKRNDSFVNKLYSSIPDQRINLRWLKDKGCDIEPFDYTMLKHNRKKQKCPKKIIEKYQELVKKYGFKLTMEYSDSDSFIILLIRFEFSELGYSDEVLVDYLIEYLYGANKRNKTIMWVCYGAVIINNLKNNLHLVEKDLKVVQCQECGEYYEVPRKNNRTRRCFACQSLADEISNRKRQAKHREENK